MSFRGGGHNRREKEGRDELVAGLLLPPPHPPPTFSPTSNPLRPPRRLLPFWAAVVYEPAAALRRPVNSFSLRSLQPACQAARCRPLSLAAAVSASPPPSLLFYFFILVEGAMGSAGCDSVYIKKKKKLLLLPPFLSRPDLASSDFNFRPSHSSDAPGNTTPGPRETILCGVEGEGRFQGWRGGAASQGQSEIKKRKCIECIVEEVFFLSSCCLGFLRCIVLYQCSMLCQRSSGLSTS